MLTENQIVLARSWIFRTPTSHHEDGCWRLRKYMIAAGVDLPNKPAKEPCETEKFLLVVYFDALEDLVRQQGMPAVA